LIAVKRDFDVEMICTRHGLRIECVRVKCSKYSYYAAYDVFVEDMDAIVGSSIVTDRILVLDDFNLKSSRGSRRMGRYVVL
jgi:hypothetical protein